MSIVVNAKMAKHDISICEFEDTYHTEEDLQSISLAEAGELKVVDK